MATNKKETLRALRNVTDQLRILYNYSLYIRREQLKELSGEKPAYTHLGLDDLDLAQFAIVQAEKILCRSKIMLNKGE